MAILAVSAALVDHDLFATSSGVGFEFGCPWHTKNITCGLQVLYTAFTVGTVLAPECVNLIGLKQGLVRQHTN